MSIVVQSVPDEEATKLANRIRTELRRLCISGHLRGYHYLVYMLLQVVLDPNRLMLITKSLYPDTGYHFGVSAASVERGTRTSISNCWNRGGRDALDQMACRHLIEYPTVSEFIDIVADYIRRTS